MRNRPTPAASSARSATPPTLSSNGISTPSAVRPGPVVSASRRRASAPIARTSGAVRRHDRSTPRRSRRRPTRPCRRPRPGCPAHADDRRQPPRPRQDRRVAGRPAAPGHDRDHRRVEQRRVRRRQVVGDQHERLAGTGQAGHRLVEQPRDRAVPDVGEVGGPLGEVAAEGRRTAPAARRPRRRSPTPLGGPRRSCRPPPSASVMSAAIIASVASTSAAAPSTSDAIRSSSAATNASAAFARSTSPSVSSHRGRDRRQDGWTAHRVHRARRESGTDAEALQVLRHRVLRRVQVLREHRGHGVERGVRAVAVRGDGDRVAAVRAERQHRDDAARVDRRALAGGDPHRHRLRRPPSARRSPPACRAGRSATRQQRLSWACVLLDRARHGSMVTLIA